MLPSRTAGLVAVVLAAISCLGCSVSTGLSPSVTLTGFVISNPSGAPVAGATLSFAEGSVETGADGRFTLTNVEQTIGKTITIRAPGHFDRRTKIEVRDREDLVIDLIADAPPFSLAAYREMARDGYENPAALSQLRVWSRAPRFFIHTVHEDRDAVIPQDLVDAARLMIARSIPDLTGGRFQAAAIDAGPDVPVSAQATNGLVIVRFVLRVPRGLQFAGQATVGESSPGTIWLKYAPTAIELNTPCPAPINTLRHELVHTMGFFHMGLVPSRPAGTSPYDLVTPGVCSGARPDISKLHTGIAYSRRANNRDIDVDAWFSGPLSVGGAETSVACAFGAISDN